MEILRIINVLIFDCILNGQWMNIYFFFIYLRGSYLGWHTLNRVSDVLIFHIFFGILQNIFLKSFFSLGFRTQLLFIYFKLILVPVILRFHCLVIFLILYENILIFNWFIRVNKLLRLDFLIINNYFISNKILINLLSQFICIWSFDFKVMLIIFTLNDLCRFTLVLFFHVIQNFEIRFFLLLLSKKSFFWKISHVHFSFFPNFLLLVYFLKIALLNDILLKCTLVVH